MTGFCQTETWGEIAQAVHGMTPVWWQDEILILGKSGWWRNHWQAHDLTEKQAQHLALYDWRVISCPTRHIDLTQSEGALLASFERNARQGIKKAEQDGFVASECAGYPAYIKCFVIPFFKSRHQPPNIIAEGLRWELGRDHGCRFFYVPHPAGHVVATLGTVCHDGVAVEIMSSRTSDAGSAQDLLHWHVMLAHKAAGDKVFDVAGYAAEPKNAKELGIKRFKQKWGGTEVLTWRAEK